MENIQNKSQIERFFIKITTIKLTLIDNPCDLHNLFIKTAPNQPYLILSNK